jgi:hypothetical protein
MSERRGYEPTKRERKYILERDGLTADEAEVHHIVPIAYAIALLGMAREDINHPLNLIALPKPEHRAIHKPPHQIGNWRETGDPYWNTHRDEELREIAALRTMLLNDQNNE